MISSSKSYGKEALLKKFRSVEQWRIIHYMNWLKIQLLKNHVEDWIPILYYVLQVYRVKQSTSSIFLERIGCIT